MQEGILLRTIWEFFKKLIPDSIFLRIKFRMKMGKPLHLRHPQTFNEKLQWLKLHDRNPEYTKLVDKYEVKNVVAKLIGEQYIIPTYGVWNSFDEIDFDSLPDQFVLKCTHDSGGLVICRDKSQFDMQAARNKLTTCLSRNYYYCGREWPYKNVKPRIIAEKYMEDKLDYRLIDDKVFNNAGKGKDIERNTDELIDYKFYCFNGEPKYLYVSQGLENHATAHISFLTLDWDFAPFNRNDYMPFEKLPVKPKHYNEMIKFAQKFAEGYKFLRVDFYEISGEIYFSEFTFSPCSGMMPFNPTKWDEKLGEMLQL